MMSTELDSILINAKFFEEQGYSKTATMANLKPWGQG
jgi:hypothetical protein